MAAEIGALSCVRAFKSNDLDTMTFSHFKSGVRMAVPELVHYPVQRLP